MNKQEKRLIIFSLFLMIALVFWRLKIFLFYDSKYIPILRKITGLNIHHYHYGVIFVLIACLIFIFYKVNNTSVALAGFGFGTFFDGFASRLLGSSSRKIEIANYNRGFGLTVFIFIIIIMLSLIFYLSSKNQN